MPKHRNSKKCFKCGQIILETENYCSLVSHSKGMIVHQDHWHAECWKEWNADRLTKAMLKVGAQAMKQMPELTAHLKKGIDGGAVPGLVAP